MIKGHKHTEETREKMRLSHSLLKKNGVKRSYSEEGKQKRAGAKMAAGLKKERKVSLDLSLTLKWMIRLR